MWVHSRLIDEGIELRWQVRTEIIGNQLVVYDANGEVESSINRSEAVFPDTMRSAGVIPLDDAFVEFCGEDRFEDFMEAVLRHSAYMLAGGYGDRPEDIVEWFTEIGERKFLDGVSYKIIGEDGEFRDLVGVKGIMLEDEGFIFRTKIGNDGFDIPIGDDKSLTSFMIVTIPF